MRDDWEVTDVRTRGLTNEERLEMTEEQSEDDVERERDNMGHGGHRFRDSHCNEDSHSQRSGDGQRHVNRQRFWVRPKN